MKKIIAMLALCSLALVVSPAQAETTVVGTDANNDWGTNVDPELAGTGSATGMELVSASIAANGDDAVTFIFGLDALPDGGGVPEGVRYLWEIDVEGTHFELDGKFSNYSRGACDPTAGTCPPARDPGAAPFVLRGNCTSTGATLCQELALVHATFDTASDTISVPVPISAFGTGDCVAIGPGQNTASFPGANVLAVPSAFLSHNALPHDSMLFDYETPVEVC